MRSPLGALKQLPSGGEVQIGEYTPSLAVLLGCPNSQAMDKLAAQLASPFPLLRIVLSVAFLYFGFQKLLGFAPAVEMYAKLGFGQTPRYFTGLAEVIGALLLWWQGKQLWGAVLLTGTMLIASFALLVYLGPPYHPVPLLLAGSAFLIWAFRHQLPLDSKLTRA